MNKATKPTETFACDSERRFGKTGRTWHGTAGTVVFQDGFGRWNRETADGTESSFETAAEAFSGVVAPVLPIQGPPAPAFRLADGTLCFLKSDGRIHACYAEFAKTA